MTAGSGKVVGEGRFRVDRRRALEKMERFQLEDPHRYVLEWVSAAVVAGAERIDVVNDADDLRISWACGALAPTGDDLDRLFDHLWGSPEDPRGAMLQHLGIGVLGALGLGPRWVHVDAGTEAGDVRLAVLDPTVTRHAPLGTDEVDGVRCHVREQLTATTVREALTAMFSEPTESRLIQGAARWAPVTVNGRRMAPPAPPATAILDWSSEQGRLWFAVRPAPPIDLVRHGVVVGHLALEIGPFAVGGGWRADALRLNASRSGLVEDERWRRVESAIHDTVDRILRRQLGPALASADERWITWHGEGDRARIRYRATHQELLRRLAAAGIARLLQRRRSLGGLDDVPALSDLAGGHHSLDALRRAKGRVGTTSRAISDPEFAAEGEGRLVFDGVAAEVIRQVMPETPDWTAELEGRAEGRRRRAEAERERQAPVFPATLGPQRTVRDGDLALAVRFRPGRVGTRGTILVHVRIGGVPLCTIEVDGPAARLEAILDDPGFTADAAFRTVIRDARFGGAVARLRREALELIIGDLADGGEPDVALLTELLARSDAAKLAAVVQDADPRLRELPMLRTGTGRALSLAQVAAAEGWWVTASLPPGCPVEVAERVLVVPSEVRVRWARWLGFDADAERSLLARIERERRLAAPRRTPALGSWYPTVVPIDAGGIRGEIAATSHVGSDAEIEVLRDGVAVRVVRWNLSLTGVVGVVDGPELDVTDAHDDLTAAGMVAVQVAVLPAVDALALAMWRATRAGTPPADRLLDWLRAHLDAPGTGPLPVAYRADGRALCVADLRALAANKRGAKLKVVREDTSDVPGYEDAVPHTAALERVLNAVAPTAWRDATDSLREDRHRLRAFLQQPVFVEPAALARIEIRDPDGRWSGVALLPDGEGCGRPQVTILWRGRLLATVAGEGVGGWLIVSGDALQPNRRFDGVSARGVGHLQREARLALEVLLDAALARSGRLDAAPVPWLALVTRIAEHGSATQRARTRPIEVRPLLQRVGGPAVSLDEVRAAGSKARVVAADLAEGPVDELLYVRDVPGLAAAVAALYGVELRAGDADLAAWRTGHGRRNRLRQRPPVVDTSKRIVARRPLPGGGEVALLGEGAPELCIEPHVDARPLRTERLPLPVRALAVVAGEGFAADPTFEYVVPSPGWTRRIAEVRAAVEVAVHQVLGGPLAGDAQLLAWRWVLAEGVRTAEVELDVPFPRVDGGVVTYRELLARVEQDGALAVSSVRTPMPRGLQPVLATEALRPLLAARFPLVEIRRSPPAVAHGSIRPPPPRSGGLRPGPAGIEIRVEGQRVTTLQKPPGPMSLEGWIDDPALQPTPLWNDVARDRAWTALSEWIAAASADALVAHASLPTPPASLLETLIGLTSDGPPPRAPQDAVLRALYAAPLLPDSTGGRVSLASVLAAGAARRVPPDARGEALPGRLPFLTLDDRVRSWLAKAVRVEEAVTELARETAGCERRRSRPWHKGRPPRRAVVWRGRGELAGVEVTLWLASDLTAAGPQVLDEGRLVSALTGYRVPGLTGWVDGRFGTDDAYTRAAIPTAVRDEIQATVVALLQAEADGGSDERTRLFRRLEAAMAGRQLQDVAYEAGWRDVVLFVDLAGGPVHARDLVHEVKRRRRLEWDVPGATGAADGLVLALSAADQRLVEQLLPGIPVEQVGAQARMKARLERRAVRAAKEAQAKELAKARVREAAAAVRRRRDGLLEAVAALGGGKEGGAAAEAWLARHPDAGSDELAQTLAAWEIVSAVAVAAGSPEAELDVIAAVAERLARPG